MLSLAYDPTGRVREGGLLSRFLEGGSAPQAERDDEYPQKVQTCRDAFEQPPDTDLGGHHERTNDDHRPDERYACQSDQKTRRGAHMGVTSQGTREQQETERPTEVGDHRRQGVNRAMDR